MYCGVSFPIAVIFLRQFSGLGRVFTQDSVYKNATALCVLQIGELTTHLTDDFKNTYTGIPWTQIKALRNVVAHNYGKIDDESLWETITSDIPKLKDYYSSIIQQLDVLT